MAATALPTPSPFQRAQAEWSRHQGPQYYRGIWFDFEILEKYLKADPERLPSPF